jgi:hypothetical protein
MKRIGAITAAIGASVLLSGCSLVSLGLDARDFAKQQEAVDKMNTATNVPTSGFATYEGIALMGAEYGNNDNVVFLGDGALVADFANDDLNGAVTDINGITLTDAQRKALQNGDIPKGILFAASSASGQVNISASNIGAALTGNADGTLNMDGDKYVVSGGLTGEYLGNGATAVKLNDGSGFIIKRNGSNPTGSAFEFNGQ